MQPAGSYAKVSNMINKIIAGILGDDQKEVTTAAVESHSAA